MKKLIQVISNIFKIDELRQRIIYTLGLILIYRFGSYVVLPGIDPTQLEKLKHATSEGLLGLLDMFSGGAFSNASIFALGIMPYISASIIVQLLTVAIPYFQKLQKEGESGRKKINQITRYLTVIVLLVQAPSYLTSLHYTLPESAFILTGRSFTITSMIILTAGTIFIMWLGEKITDKGIGNGISLIIMIGIIARFPHAFVAEMETRMLGAGGLIVILLEILFLLFVIAASIMLVQATRRIPVQYAKKIVGNKQYGGVRQFLPLKINASGVMPIIFAQSLMFIPTIIAGFTSDTAAGFLGSFTRYTSLTYNIIFFILIIAFTYFYTAIIFNPIQIADDLKRNGGFIPGIKPGKKTAEYIDQVLSRITLPGAIFLGIIAIMPAFAVLIGISGQFAQFFGGTSLLILVGVVLDTLQQIESYLIMRHYDGFLKSGKIKGRSPQIASI
ncbi:MAG: preprotein translocase subunit SecY [Bacteroidales bacterium]|nr:preprotein translocase subunit SecY [Bacteroidales bacterium]